MRTPRACRAFPSRASSRCPSRAPRRSRRGRSAARSSARPRPAYAGSARAGGRRHAGSSAASTSACPKRRARLRVGSRREVGTPGRNGAAGSPAQAHASPCAQHAQRLLVQVLGQIGDGGLDLRVNRMDRRVGRAAQREQREPHAAPLERAQLLRDERLGQARIALEHDADAARAARSLSASCPSSRHASLESRW